MRQEQERFRSFARGSAPDGAPLGVDTNPPGRWNPIDTSGAYRRLVEASSIRRFQEIHFSLRQENDAEREEDHQENEGFDRSKQDFEPFVNPEFQEQSLFVNNYGGAYFQKMELNRSRVERALKIAHLGGKVFLTTLV